MRQRTENVSPMSNKGRNAYVLEHLTEACLRLLQKKPLECISIRELCDCADVGRASFYRNFENKEDILKKYLHRLFFDCMNEYENAGEKSLNRLICFIFSHFESHWEFYELMNKRNLIFLLKDSILEICGSKLDQAKEEAYAKAFFSYALYGWIEVWFQRGMKESAEEMTQLFQSQGL